MSIHKFLFFLHYLQLFLKMVIKLPLSLMYQGEVALHILNEHPRIYICYDFNFQFHFLLVQLILVNIKLIIHYILQILPNYNYFFLVILKYNPNEQQILLLDYSLTFIIFLMYYLFLIYFQL